MALSVTVDGPFDGITIRTVRKASQTLLSAIRVRPPHVSFPSHDDFDVCMGDEIVDDAPSRWGNRRACTDIIVVSRELALLSGAQ